VDGGEVLFCQNLRRGHQSRLITIGHGGQKGCRGDHGFTAADFSLQEAGHGYVFLHIAKYFS